MNPITTARRTNRGRRRVLAASTGALAALALPAGAQSWPNGPLRWIVPYNAGGATDVVSRLIGEGVGKALGQKVVVDNRAGAASTIGMQALLAAPADGQTLITADNATLFNNWHLFPNLTYKPDSFEYVAMTGRFPLVLTVNGDVPVRSFEEWVKWAKANAGKVNYATPGVGSPHHIAMASINDRLQLKMQHVPYKGDSAAVVDLIGGAVPTMLMGVATARQYLKDSRLRLLAVTWPTRLSSLPDVLTLDEAGLKGHDVVAEQGVLMKAGTPRAVVERLNREIGVVLSQPDVVAHLEKLGMYPVLKSPDEFRAHVLKQAEVAGDIIRRNGITIN